MRLSFGSIWQKISVKQKWLLVSNGSIQKLTLRSVKGPIYSLNLRGTGISKARWQKHCWYHMWKRLDECFSWWIRKFAHKWPNRESGEGILGIFLLYKVGEIFMAEEEHAQKQIREDTSRVKLARYHSYDTSCLVIEDQSQYQGGMPISWWWLWQGRLLYTISFVLLWEEERK